MKNYLKKAAGSLIVLVILAGLLPVSSFADGFELSSKHVCIVYDDSGSMYEEQGAPIMNWARENYMVQAFCALLNSNDSLNIMYMSDIEAGGHRGDYISNDRALSLSEIRAWHGDSQTPFAAVEAAYETLLSMEGQTGDEYWLVIMTDGRFQGIEGSLDERLSGYIGEIAQAGKTLKIVFLAMGASAEPPEADEENGLLVYKTDELGIIATMLALSDNISARQTIPYSDIHVDGNKITFSTAIAPASLIILNQDSRNAVESVHNNDGILKVSDQYYISAPEPFTRQNSAEAITDDSLSGVVMHYTPSSGYLSPGKYTITFNSQVNIKKIRILYQPAITLQFRYLSQGMIIENPEDGDTVDIETLLINSATGKPFDASILGGQLGYTIRLISQGEAISTETTPVIKDVLLKDGDTAVAAEVVMPGYFTLRSRLDYTEQAVDAPDSEKPSESTGPWPPEIKLVAQTGQYSKVKLKNLEDTVFKLTPYYNGEQATAQDLEKGTLEISCARNVEFSCTISPDGSFDLKPAYGGDILSTSTGTIAVTLVYTSQYGSKASTTMSFLIEDMGWVQRNINALMLPFILAFFAILISGILFFHKRFPKDGGIEYSHYTKNRMGEWKQSLQPFIAGFENLKGPWNYIPFSSARTCVSGITFYPDTNDQYVIVSLKHVKGDVSTDPKDALVKKGTREQYILKAGVILNIEYRDYKIVLRYIAPKHSMIKK